MNISVARSRPFRRSALSAVLGVVLVMPLATTACTATRTPAARGALHPEAAVIDRLWFGRSIPGGGYVSAEEWKRFVDEVITPRFPEGVTLWAAEGQWRDAQGAVIQENVMVLEVIHRGGATAATLIQEIAEEYRQRFKQEAVLHVRAAGEMRLYE